MKISTISYGVGMAIIAATLHYAVIPGIENCNSMAGIVSTYTSEDFSLGCGLLSNLQVVAIAFEASGAGIAIFGLIQKPKIK